MEARDAVEFEVTCKVTKGERDIAYGEDCYCYYTQPNYNERIVRCRDCGADTTPDGVRLNYRRYCILQDRIVEPNGFCAWGEVRDD